MNPNAPSFYPASRKQKALYNRERAFQAARSKPLPPVPGPQRQRGQRKRRAPSSNRGAGPDSSMGPLVGLASAYARGQRGGVSTAESARTGMQHELIATVAGSTTFVASPFVINPGNPTTFPWLSDIAAKWESYRFNYLRFRYETRKGTSTDGSVIMAIDYDPTDAPPVSEAVMTTYSGAVEDATWKNSACTAAVSQLHKIGPQKYVRQGILPSGGNIMDFDCGNFIFATTAQVDTSSIGKLWVDYDVTFYTKQTAAGLSAPANNRVAWYQSSADEALSTGVAKTVAVATETANGIGAVNAAGAITLPAGNYIIAFNADVIAATAVTSGIIDLQKNGVTMYQTPNNVPGFTIAAGAVASEFNYGGTVFAQSDGNDVFTLRVTGTGTGAMNVTGSVVIHAV